LGTVIEAGSYILIPVITGDGSGGGDGDDGAVPETDPYEPPEKRRRRRSFMSSTRLVVECPSLTNSGDKLGDV
jgi:hypothetical protein